jgi:translation initiation factor 3 subunit K
MATEQAAENYTVEDLVALNPYNPDILNDLEKFVNEQVSAIALMLFPPVRSIPL